ncbi:hypothetical protein LJC34_03105 [Oscillospiraceae bacterium OttesenSCG-928-G22]|nr:hypothetical protein [Oscillospiraceae bacterium OttesenSCG-928-G22]
MAKHMGDLPQNLSNSKEGSAVLGKMDQFKNLIDSPEGQEMISKLSASDAAEIKSAAAGFASGDAAAAGKLLGALTGSKEGKELMKSIQDILKK